MTYFSIHKKFRILVAILLIGGIGGGYAIAANAGNSTPAEEQTTEGEDLGVSAIPKATAETSTLSKKESKRVEAPIVVELYTASDCTACVFADRMLYDASQDKNVIALSCHIRDLDELEKNNENKDKTKAVSPGPVDPCVFRQWTYSAYSGNKDGIALNVPTFIMNGGDKVTADNLASFTSALNSYHYAPKNKTIEALVRWKDNDTLSIMLPEAIQTKIKVKINASVWLVRYKDMQVEKINDGVNKGRVLRFSNIIQDIKHIGKWHGAERTMEVDVPVPQGGNERGGFAVLVGEMLGEKILVAGKVSDYPTAKDVKKSKDAAP